MKNNINYYYYLVAFIDVLGQKELFQTLDGIALKDNHEKLIDIHKKTVAFIEVLRKAFDDFFDEYTKERDPVVKVPESKKEQFKEMCKVQLKHQRFSDCIQAFVCLHTDKYYSNVINGVFGALLACGGLLLLSLAEKRAFRAGIEVGLGIELNNGEIYGPALFKAYELENKIAQYPRIVIGNELVNYLITLVKRPKQSETQTKEDIEMCKNTAENCLKMFVKDLDGRLILDYLGNEFRQNAIDNYSNGEDKIPFKDICKKAFRFTKEEYDKRRNIGNSKLALRYYLLYNYFRTKMSEKDMRD